jgi:2-succinyl-5-enolpyruvyl-6-hydroxy-3-cyclohexene-1-carboxylate synthase
MLRYPLYHTSEICFQNGIDTAVISPGSRNAPLTLSFSRNEKVKKLVIPDERSAGFIALGIAQATQKPVALVCTSGSALLNYAPAISEAYFRNVPLVILSADRPPEWIDQWDGQTIHQYDVLSNHVKKSFELPVSTDHADAAWSFERKLAEAVFLAQKGPKGPVHVNIPIREPFYPDAEEKIEWPEKVKKLMERAAPQPPDKGIIDEIVKAQNNGKRILVIMGQFRASEELIEALSEAPLPIIADIISNGHAISGAVTLPDSILMKSDEHLRQLKPDIVISFGQSVISKNLKLYLRKNKPEKQYHIDPDGQCADPFQSLTEVVATRPEIFFNTLKNVLHENEAYKGAWSAIQNKAQEANKQFISMRPTYDFNEFHAVAYAMKHLPERAHLHLANSMAVRYANFVGLHEQRGVEVFANRGTSGIDGCVSTAVGAALESGLPTYLIVGDLAFFYDRNGLWHNHLPDNLRVILLNNHAGGIFRMIDGPARLPELEQYFETRQQLNAKNTCGDAGLDYFHVNTFQALEEQWKGFQSPTGRLKLIEIETKMVINKEVFVQYKQLMRNGSL